MILGREKAFLIRVQHPTSGAPFHIDVLVMLSMWYDRETVHQRTLQPGHIVLIKWAEDMPQVPVFVTDNAWALWGYLSQPENGLILGHC